MHTLPMPPLLRLVHGSTAHATKPASTQPTAPPQSYLDEMVRHPDGSVTLDGYLILPSYADRTRARR